MADRYWVAGGTGNYNSTTNWSATSGGASGASVPGAGDNIFFNAASGSGTATINIASSCANLNLTGFTGTLAFNNSLTPQGTSINLGLGTYTVTGVGYLRFAATMSITSNGTNYTGNMAISAPVIITLADNLTCSGTFDFTASSGTMTLNGNTLNISGSLLHSTGVITSGTTTIVFNGTGTWSHTSTGYLRNNVTINTSGTLTLGTQIRWHGNSTSLIYISGTVVTTGNYFALGGTGTWNGTVTTNGINWNDIGILGTNTITLGSNLTLTGILAIGTGTTSFVLGGNSLISTNANLTMGPSGTFTMPANQTFKTLTTTGNATINTNTLTITENIVIGASAAISGTTAIIYAGTGTWTTGNSSSIINNNLTINTAGTLTITGLVYKSLGTFTYTAGTIIDTGATVIVGTVGSTTLNVSGKIWEKLLVTSTTTLTSNINAITFGTVAGQSTTNFILGGNTINLTHLELGAGGTTTLPFAWVCQNLNIAVNSGSILTGFSITVNGDILQSGNGSYGGTTTFIYAGTGTWSRTGTGYFGNNFTINTSGTLIFSGGSIGGGIFTYTAGTINILPGSVLYNNVSGTTFNDGSIVWYDVVFGLVSGVLSSMSSVVLNDQLVCSNTLRISAFNITYSGTNGTFDVYNLILQNDTSNRTMSLVSTKTYRVRQSLTAIVSTSSSRFLLMSTIVGSRAIFTVDSGATIDVGFVNATDIDSSLGRPIYSYRGVFSNTLNWNLLPTDVTPKVNTFAN